MLYTVFFAALVVAGPTQFNSPGGDQLLKRDACDYVTVKCDCLDPLSLGYVCA